MPNQTISSDTHNNRAIVIPRPISRTRVHSSSSLKLPRHPWKQAFDPERRFCQTASGRETAMPRPDCSFPRLPRFSLWRITLKPTSLTPCVAFAIRAICLYFTATISPVAWVVADEYKDSTPQVSAESAPLTTTQLAERIRKSLVIVRATGRDGRQYGHGTGFVIAEDGLIATARHVIGDRRDVSVEFQDGTRMPVTHVHAVTDAVDLAVVRVEAKGLTPLQLGNSEITKDGQSVVTVGYPGTTEYSVFRGLISGRHEIEGIQMLKLSMTVEPGSSGEPIVSQDKNVVGIVTLKSTAANDVGYAVPVEHLKTLLENPVDIPMTGWRTIGALDDKDWEIVFGANWRQRASRILVDGYGDSFGGRSLCISRNTPPPIPYEIQVDIRLDEPSGAAGLAFHSDGDDLHYGFYPSNGNIRLTRFNGPDLNSWTILHNEPNPVYKPGEWNTFKVRIEEDRFLCYVNETLVVDSKDDRLSHGRVGLATFRGTSAAFRRFQTAASIPSSIPTKEAAADIAQILENVNAVRPASTDVIERMSPFARHSTDVLESEAQDLERRAKHLRQLASDVHTASVVRQIRQALVLESSPDKDATPDLLRAALLVAVLDNNEIEPDGYIRRVDRMAREALSGLADDADETAKLKALDHLLFTQYGFRGSRFEYYTSSNSYLNEVIDDREGLPITLSVLYIETARRMGLNVVGLGLPGHYVVRFEPETEGQTPQIIDVFERGKRMTIDEANVLIKARGFPLLPQFFEAQKPVDIVKRMIINLLGLAEQQRKDESVLRYLEALVAIAPDDPSFRAKRLEIRARSGRLAEAIADADWFIDNQPDGTNLDSLYELRANLSVEAEEQNQKIIEQ